MINRFTPTILTHPDGIDEEENADAINEEVVALWKRVGCWLTNVGGTPNAITASADPALDAYSRSNVFWLIPAETNTGGVTINIDSLGIKDIFDVEGNILTEGDLETGILYKLVYDGTAFRIASGGSGSSLVSVAPDAIFIDRKDSGEDGGDFISGAWRVRDLTFEQRNELSGSSLEISSGQFTLQQGTYYIEWSAPARVEGVHQSKLYNATDESDIQLGQTTDGEPDHINYSEGTAVVNITSAKIFEIRHRSTGSTANGTGFGIGAGFDYEVYTTVKIWKVGVLVDQVTGQAGGPITIEYIVDLDSQADTKPNFGELKFDNVTQNAATSLYVDNIDALIVNQSDTLELISEGKIKLVKKGDSTRWLIFSVSAREDDSGYKDFTIENEASSHDDPFSNGDRVYLIAGSTATVDDVLQALGINSITVSTEDPSGGEDNDVWLKVPE